MSSDFSIHISSKDRPPSSWFERQARQWNHTDKKTVQISASVFNKETPLANIPKAVVATNNEKKEQLIQSREWVPLALVETNREDPIELTNLIFVRTQDLIQSGAISEKKAPRLNQILSQEQDFNLTVLQVKRFLEGLWRVSAENEHLYKSFLEKTQMPAEPQLIEEAGKLLAEFAPVEISDRQRQFLEPHRLGPSMTLRNEPQKLGSWREADRFIQILAKSQEPLTFEALCKVNFLCVGSVEENEILETGKLRDLDVSAGGLKGLCYIPTQHVEEEVKRLLDDIEKGVLACQKQAMNPLILAAIMTQRCISIHPFFDANGRTSYLIADYIMQRLKYPPIVKLEDQLIVLFGEQEGLEMVENEIFNSSPSTAVRFFLDGFRRTYELLAERST